MNVIDSPHRNDRDFSNDIENGLYDIELKVKKTSKTPRSDLKSRQRIAAHFNAPKLNELKLL